MTQRIFACIAMVLIGIAGGCDDNKQGDRPKTDPVRNSPAIDVAFVEKLTFEESVAESKKTGKPLLVYFTASWCPPCRTMKSTVFADASIKKKLKDFVVYYCDIDLPKNKSVIKEYRPIFERFVVPSWVAHRSGDDSVRHIKSGLQTRENYMFWLIKASKPDK